MTGYSDDDLGPDAAHLLFEELVAGRALDALDPAEDAVLSLHLPGCVRCRTALADLSATAALLAVSVSDDGAPVPALPALLAVEVAAVCDRRGVVTALRRPASRRARAAGHARSGWERPSVRLSAAAAAIVVTATATSVAYAHVHAAPGGGTHVTAAPELSRVLDSLVDGRQVRLASVSSDARAEVGVSSDGHAWLVASGLPGSTARQQYVVWSVAGNSSTTLAQPQALTGFTTGQSAGASPVVIDLGRLATSLQARGFAVSQEQAGALPAVPGAVVLTGS